MNQKRAEAAWQQIEALGGHGVWESDMVVVSLAETDVSDDDLALFVDFPYVETLDLRNNPLTDNCFKYLDHLKSLETLILIGVPVTPEAVAKFASSHPGVEVRTKPLPKGTINPFTGKPFDAT